MLSQMHPARRGAVGHPSRVLASTDCGFASTAKSTAISADIAWMKLRSPFG